MYDFKVSFVRTDRMLCGNDYYLIVFHIENKELKFSEDIFVYSETKTRNELKFLKEIKDMIDDGRMIRILKDLVKAKVIESVRIIRSHKEKEDIKKALKNTNFNFTLEFSEEDLLK